MYKLFSIAVLTLAVARVGAMQVDDKPKKAKKEAPAQTDWWKNLTLEKRAELKAKAAKLKAKAAAKAKSKQSEHGQDQSVYGGSKSGVFYKTIRAKAIPEPVTVPDLGKSDKKADDKETSIPTHRNWHSVTPEQEVEADKLIQDILTKWSRTTQFSASYKMEHASGQARRDLDGKNWEWVTRTDMLGTYDLKNDNGKIRVRMEVQPGDGLQPIYESQPQSFITTNWLDGDYMYSLEHVGDQYAAEKLEQRKGSLWAMGGEDLLKNMKLRYKLRVEPPGKLGDRDVLIIDGVTRLGDEKASLATHWFDKESGVLLKVATYEYRHRLKMRITLDDLNLKPEFPFNHFKYSAPKGVRLVDKTRKTSSATGG